MNGRLPEFDGLQRRDLDLRGREPATEPAIATPDFELIHLHGKIFSICCGPGGAPAHRIEQWISLGRLQQQTPAFAAFIARSWGPGRLRDPSTR